MKYNENKPLLPWKKSLGNKLQYLAMQLVPRKELSPHKIFPFFEILNHNKATPDIIRQQK